MNNAEESLADGIPAEWRKRHTEKAFKACDNLAEKFQAAERRTAKCREEVLLTAYIVSLLVARNGREKKWRHLLAKRGIKGKKSTHFTLLLLRWMIGPDPRARASHWTAGLRFALKHQTKPDQLFAFIGRNGGIYRCATAFRDSQRRNTLPSQQIDSPMERGEQEPRDPGPELRLELDPGFRKAFDGLAAKEENVFVRIEAHVSRNGLLTLQSIKVDEERMPFGHK